MRDFNTGERFAQPNDTNRLHQAYVFYDGVPKHILMNQDMTYNGQVVDIGDRRMIGVPVDVQNDPLLDLSSPELGFMNHSGGDALYVYRRPERQWHWLYENNCSYFSVMGNRHSPCMKPLFYCKEFENTLMGVYPKYQEILGVCKEKPFMYCKAFDRYFAILSVGEEISLWFRDEKIAKYNRQEELWDLDKQFDYPTLTAKLEAYGLNFGV